MLTIESTKTKGEAESVRLTARNYMALPSMPDLQPMVRKISVIGFAAVLLLGIFFRLPHDCFSGSRNPLHALESLHPEPKMRGVGFDEGLYREYVNALIRGGLTSYPDVVEHYIALQKGLPSSILPPVRFLYIFTAYIWHLLFGTESLAALRHVAALFNILTLLLSSFFAWRLKGPAWGLGVGALMAVAPTQIHMSQHALVDGFFTFWAVLCLWLLWENLKAPNRIIWLLAYTCALCFLVLTKENAFFVFVALAVILLSNHWLKFGVAKPELIGATILGSFLGVVVLIFLAGGWENLVATYRLSVSKNYQLPYAILTGDGPWYRYLVDLLLVSPIVLILAAGAAFRLDGKQKPELFLGIFIASSYLIMCSIKYGMNLRYANMWDMPLRFLAFTQIGFLCASARRYRPLLIGVAVTAVAILEVRQYYILEIRYPFYELVTHDLLRALSILKSAH